MMKIIELTKENEKQYLGKVVELEQMAMEAMKKEGREGQLFATGSEDISNYICSEENTVIIAEDANQNVCAATYITQGQEPFTYNDITKYFKYGEQYRKHVKSQYEDKQKYKKDLLEVYEIKIKAFEYAKNRILLEYPEYESFQDFFSQEVEINGFHEKSDLRQKLNKYMSQYIREKFDTYIQKKYEQFYWITSHDIAKEFGKEIKQPNTKFKEYDEMLKNSELIIYENTMFNVGKYYDANTDNSIELDTYITLAKSRNAGIARIIIFEGVKKHIERHFENVNNEQIFLCSTLHRDNLSSKYVSEFFGLTDSVYVKRRQDRNREVHICRIERTQVLEYLTEISNKLAVLYGYNPENRNITESVKQKVLQEQLRYEQKEYNRLRKARKTDKTFNGINLKFIDSKFKKIQRIQKELQIINKTEVKDNYER